MEIMKCKICESQSDAAFTTAILKKYEVSYYECTQCGFVQTEQPYWLEEAYANPINVSDTGIVLRNQRLSQITTSLIFLFFNRKEKFVDYAGGYGLFTRMMRDIGFDFYWSDPYTQNLVARTFEMEAGKKYHLATSFESFEHFERPVLEVAKILEITDNIILSTELLPNPIPKVSDWWYYGTEHGQHISLYTKKAFIELARQFNLHYYSLDNVHLLTKAVLPIHGRLLFQFRYAKHVLYVLSFLIGVFIKSKTQEDMNKFK